MNVEKHFEKWIEDNVSSLYLDKFVSLPNGGETLTLGFVDFSDVSLDLNFTPGSARNSVACVAESKSKHLCGLVTDLNKQIGQKRRLTVKNVLDLVNQSYDRNELKDDDMPDEFFVTEPSKLLSETDQNNPSESAASANCVVCMDDLNNGEAVRVLEKCFHQFHAECIEQCFKAISPQCPSCKVFYGQPIGKQPFGTMTTRVILGQIPGFPDSDGIIEIFYQFPNGIQKAHDPSPGQPYTGTMRVAYLPHNQEGQEVEKLLRLAFDHRLIFTIGTSVTSGKDNTVVWNGIHHKTNLVGGSSNFGYPDEHYLNRVKEELASVGITADMLAASSSKKKSEKKK